MCAEVNPYLMIVTDCLKALSFLLVLYLRVSLLVFILLLEYTATVLKLAIVDFSYAKLTLLFLLPEFLLHLHVCDVRRHQRLPYVPVILVLIPASHILPYGFCFDSSLSM